MHRKIILLGLLIFFFRQCCLAQDSVITISPDRPDQTDAPSTVPAFKFQVEEGATFADKTCLNNFLLRFGLTGSTELRFASDAGKVLTQSGFKPVALGFKQRFIQQNRFLPAVALIGDVVFGSLASKDFRQNNFPYELKLAFENDIDNHFSIGYNLGTDSWFLDLNVTFEVVYSPAEPLSVFVEYFSTFLKNNSEQNIDLGISYLINNRFEIDCAAGRAIFSSDNRLFATAGLSYLFVH